MKQDKENNQSPLNNSIDLLGDEEAAFPARNQVWKRWPLLILGVLSSFVSLYLSYSFILLIFESIRTHGRAIILHLFSPLLFFYIIIFFLGIGFIILSKVHWFDGITIFENGLAYRHSGKEQIWLYKDITRFDNYLEQVVFSGSIVNIYLTLILEDNNGRCLKLRNKYCHIDELINSLRGKTLPHLFLQIESHLKEGQSIRFHKNIEANQIGLIINGQLIAYDLLKIDIQKMNILFYNKDIPELFIFKSNLKNFKNLEILLSLVESSL